MKVLLVGINAKFIHSNLAIRSIRAYGNKFNLDPLVREYTINQSIDYILREIYEIKPDILCFSCYIWNYTMVKELVTIYKKIQPKVKIIFGGPEVSYTPIEVLKNHAEVDFVIFGEGEATFTELIEYIKVENLDINNISGIAYRTSHEIILNKPRKALKLADIPFSYENELEDYKNRIIYYESSRGCPFNCQYCLSSIEKGVRFLSLERVYEDLMFFIKNEVKQVKFVDRTFNCNKDHALSIWKFIKKWDNGRTNFHFEISADLLDDETIEFLATLRPQLIQLEIGVQTTNPNTIQYIQRKTNLNRIYKVVERIKEGKNIHQHLDLIAGLPGEDYESFGNSFNQVYKLQPEQLQLGFLKILKGSGLFRDKEKYGLVYKDIPPYEILKTDVLPFDDVLMLKMIEEMVERYYNSLRFVNTIKYLEGFFETPFSFYENLARYWTVKELHKMQHNKMKYYKILHDFFLQNVSSDDTVLLSMMKYDIYVHEKEKKLPDWLKDGLTENKKMEIREFYQEIDNIYKYLPELKDYSGKQISRIAHIEVFPFDIINYDSNIDTKMKNTAVLFNYLQKNPVTGKAKTYIINL